MRCVKSLLALTLAVCPVSHVLALPSDSSQPIRIQADSATLDDKRNTAVYTGNVIITQGSMRLTGGRVTLSTNANGELNTMVTYGSPATYQQTPEANKAPVKARAQTIEYHADRETIVLIQEAFLEQSGNTFQGDYVSYDIPRQVVDAGRGSESANGSQNGGGGRIEIVIQPRSRSNDSGTDSSNEEPATP